jgi:hypothetical protein
MGLRTRRSRIWVVPCLGCAARIWIGPHSVLKQVRPTLWLRRVHSVEEVLKLVGLDLEGLHQLDKLRALFTSVALRVHTLVVAALHVGHLSLWHEQLTGDSIMAARAEFCDGGFASHAVLGKAGSTKLAARADENEGSAHVDEMAQKSSSGGVVVKIVVMAWVSS